MTWDLHNHFPGLIAPDLREQKFQEIRVVVTGALDFYKSGQWELYCDSITKLLGMAAAFSRLDDGLYNYTMDWVNALSRFTLQHTVVDFEAWALGQAFKPFQGLTIKPAPEHASKATQSPVDPALAAQNRQLASKYLDERPQLQGRGVVVLFQGQVSGWMNELRNPEEWEPGCIAVDRRGNQYLAIGGDSYRGATAWNWVWTAKSEGAAA